jgi:hypothetical protein
MGWGVCPVFPLPPCISRGPEATPYPKLSEHMVQGLLDGRVEPYPVFWWLFYGLTLLRTCSNKTGENQGTTTPPHYPRPFRPPHYLGVRSRTLCRTPDAQPPEPPSHLISSWYQGCCKSSLLSLPDKVGDPERLRWWWPRRGGFVSLESVASGGRAWAAASSPLPGGSVLGSAASRRPCWRRNRRSSEWRIPEKVVVLHREIPHQRGRAKRGRLAHRDAPPPRRTAVRMLVAPVDAVGQLPMAPEVLAAVTAYQASGASITNASQPLQHLQAGRVSCCRRGSSRASSDIWWS